MTATKLNFRTGEKIAIRSSRGCFSFDDLHRLRPLICKEIAKHWKIQPRRVLGCLEDDVDALFALLFLTEITDFMPVNPALSNLETTGLLQSSGVDVAVVSRAFLSTKHDVFSSTHVLVWDDIIDDALAALRDGEDENYTTIWTNPGRLILHTSGSTGTPKRVPITLDAMNASARNIAAGHYLQDDDHALNALPTFHIGALVDVMLAPFVAGGSISITDKRTSGGLVQALIDQRPTWLQVVPTLLRRLVEDIAPNELTQAGRSLRFIRSISAPVPSDLKQQVEDVFGCPVIEMYGMTETAGQIATVARTRSSFKAGSVGVPVGAQVAIMDRFGNVLKTEQTGEVCVNGPTVFGGYENTTKEDVFFEGWFRTGDLGKIDQDGYLFLQGRLKEMVNVGGEKVSPHEVETAVLDMPDVIEAASYSVPHPTLGEQVGLTIAVRGVITPDEVKTFLEGRLAGFKCPNSISIVEQLPRLANAKVDRVLLKRNAHAEWQDRQSSTATSGIDHATSEARAVASHWTRILKCRPPEGDDDFFDMGGDSLSATQLLLTLEKALGRQISPNQLFEAPTFSGLVGALTKPENAPAKRSPRPIRYIQEKTAGWPGQIVVANGLLRSLGSLKPAHPLFWASQAQSEIEAIRENVGKKRPIYVTGSLRRFRKRTEQDFEVVGAQLADEIMSIQPSGPIALGGFCGGAWVMHHAAEKLLGRGRDIRVFISFDYWPSRELNYPIVHCMSNCEINSARVHFARHTLTESLIHPSGVMTLNVDSKHRCESSDLAPHMSVLNSVLDGTQKIPPTQSLAPNTWSLEDRLRPPHARLKFIGRPFTYAAGGTATFGVEVTNTSSVSWQPTDVSGLSVQVDLVNLDGYMRKANVAYGELDKSVPVGGSVKFSFDVAFPDKRIPMWLSCSLVSQGLAHFRTRASGGRKSLIVPRLRKSRSLTASN